MSIAEYGHLLANADKPKSNGVWLIAAGVVIAILFLTSMYPRLRRHERIRGGAQGRLIAAGLAAPFLIVFGTVQLVQGR